MPPHARLTIHPRAPIFPLALAGSSETGVSMRVGVFTPLLSQVSLPQVLKKLAALRINTVELGTGNYPGDAHCKLAMLENGTALAEFKSVLADSGGRISAWGGQGNRLLP